MAAILHRVKRGETIMSICLAYGLTYDKFVELQQKFLRINEMDLMRLWPGDTIVVGDSADPIDLMRVMERRQG